MHRCVRGTARSEVSAEFSRTCRHHDLDCRRPLIKEGATAGHSEQIYVTRCPDDFVYQREDIPSSELRFEPPAHRHHTPSTGISGKHPRVLSRTCTILRRRIYSVPRAATISGFPSVVRDEITCWRAHASYRVRTHVALCLSVNMKPSLRSITQALCATPLFNAGGHLAMSKFADICAIKTDTTPKQD